MWREMKSRSASSRVSSPSRSSATSSRSRGVSPARGRRARARRRPRRRGCVTAIPRRAAVEARGLDHRPAPVGGADADARRPPGLLAPLDREQPPDDVPDDPGIPSGNGVPDGLSAANQARAAAVAPRGCETGVQQQHARLRRRRLAGPATGATAWRRSAACEHAPRRSRISCASSASNGRLVAVAVEAGTSPQQPRSSTATQQSSSPTPYGARISRQRRERARSPPVAALRTPT